jgi:hypothetical protein
MGRPSLPLLLKVALLCCPWWPVEVTTAGVLTAGVPGAIIAHHRPVARDRAPPPAPIHSRLGESSCAIIRPSSFPCPDADLRQLTIVGAQFLCRIPPRRWLPNCRSSSLPEKGSWTAERAPSSRGRRACWSPPVRSGRWAQDVTPVTPTWVPPDVTTSPR